MLLVYLDPLNPEQDTLLLSWDPRARFWPRSYVYSPLGRVAADYFISFNDTIIAYRWIMAYGERSRIVVDFPEH